jgi:hypothetical protein
MRRCSFAPPNQISNPDGLLNADRGAQHEALQPGEHVGRVVVRRRIHELLRRSHDAAVRVLQ